MIIAGLHGKKRGGKDTLAEILVRSHGFTRIAFADPIKQMLRVLCIPEEYTESDKNTPIPGFSGKTYTELCQTLGTEWGRNMIDPYLWIRHAEQALINAHRETGATRFVFSDVRYTEEADMVRALGGRIVFVEGRGEVVNDHTSEAPLPEAYRDLTIYNDGSIPELAGAVSSMLVALVR